MRSRREQRIEELKNKFENQKVRTFTAVELLELMRLFNSEALFSSPELDEITNKIRARIKDVRKALDKLENSLIHKS